MEKIIFIFAGAIIGFVISILTSRIEDAKLEKGIFFGAIAGFIVYLLTYC
jgi:uncharacterized membrane protein YjfL (UPF0719 family)